MDSVFMWSMYNYIIHSILSIFHFVWNKIRQAVDLVIHLLTCTFYTSKQVNLLASQISDLEKVREKLDEKVTEAQGNREPICKRVSLWQLTVPNILEQSRNLKNTAEKKMELRWKIWEVLKQRYRTSADVKGKLKEIADKLQDVFDKVTAEENEWLPRDRLLSRILEELLDDKVTIVGVYGVAGVGKTTLVEKLMERAKEESLFNTVAMAVVSERADVKRIQEEIAWGIGFSLDQPWDDHDTDQISSAAAAIATDHSVTNRAKKLHKRLEKELQEKKRVLILLDDIRMTKLDLCTSIGIPKNCKIVLSTRTKEVCDEMDAHKSHEVFPFETPRSWTLFIRSLPPNDPYRPEVTSGDLRDVANTIVEHCRGFPLAITSVAKVLENHRGERDIWLKVADELESRENKDDLLRGVLQVTSGKFTESTDKIMSLFRLCCLFPGNSAIGVEELVRYGIGLGLFPDDQTLDNSINTSTKWVQELQSFNFLMDRRQSHNRQDIRMHDSMRLAAISLKGDQELLVRTNPNAEFWTERNTRQQKYYAISVVLSSQGVLKLPGNLKCSKLHILRLECCSFRSNFYFSKRCFDRMEKLRVLVINKACFWKDLPPLRSLKHLKTLCLDGCTGVESLISPVITSLTSLEILSLRGSDMSKVPEGLTQLTHLRVLDLTGCHKLKTIPSDMINSLPQSLQGLYMLGSFKEWNTESAASLASLSRLKVLQTEIGVEHLPDELPFIDNSFCFAIKTDAKCNSLYFNQHINGDLTHCYGSKRKVLELQDVSITTARKPSVTALLREALELQLYKVKDLKDIDSLRPTKNWKKLTIDSCDDLEYLIRQRDQDDDQDALSELGNLELRNLPSLKQICHANIGCQNALSNLTAMYAIGCHQLKCLPLGSKGQFPQNIKSLGIWYCSSLDSIFATRVEEQANQTETIALPNLECLKIWGAHRLKTFCSPPAPPESESFFSEKDSLSALKHLEIGKVQLIDIWDDKKVYDRSFNKLQTLRLSYCINIREVIPFSLLSNLRKLKELSISHCDNLESILSSDGKTREEIPLKELSLKSLARLTHINLTDYMVKSLCSISVGGCPILASLFSAQIAKSMLHLKYLDITDCNELKVVFEGSLEIIEEIELPELRQIRFHSLSCLHSFCTKLCHVELPKLESLEIIDCPCFQQFSSRPMHGTRKLPHIKLSNGAKLDFCEELNETIKVLHQEVSGNGENKATEDKLEVERGVEDAERELRDIKNYLHDSYTGRRIYFDPKEHQVYIGKIRGLLEKLKAFKEKKSTSISVQRKIKPIKKGLKTLLKELDG